MLSNKFKLKNLSFQTSYNTDQMYLILPELLYFEDILRECVTEPKQNIQYQYEQYGRAAYNCKIIYNYLFRCVTV